MFNLDDEETQMRIIRLLIITNAALLVLIGVIILGTPTYVNADAGGAQSPTAPAPQPQGDIFCGPGGIVSCTIHTPSAGHSGSNSL